MELGPQFPQATGKHRGNPVASGTPNTSGSHRASPTVSSPDTGRHAKDYSPGKDIAGSMSTSSKAGYKAKHTMTAPGTAGTTGPAPIKPNAGSAGKTTQAKVPSEAKPRPKQAGHTRLHHVTPVEHHMQSVVGFSGDKGRTVV